MTRKELNQWLKGFNIGDKVKFTGASSLAGLEGVVEYKTSFVFVRLEDGDRIQCRGFLELIEKK